MNVQFLDLAAAHAEVADELDAVYRAVVAGGRYVLGSHVAAFEAEWAAYTDAAYCVGVGNGFDALTLSLRAVGVGPGDDVIVPSNTYVATWLAVSAVGARPVGCEPDPTGNLDPSLLAAVATAQTRAVVPVHMYGQPAAMGAVRDWARAQGAAVVVDAAQAHGARLRDAGVGGLGDVTAWSFYPSKNLGALGDGGAITTDDPELARQVAVLRQYGSDVRDHHVALGVNSRLDELQAAFLRVKLPRLDEWNARRSAVAARYTAGLAGLPLTLPVVTEGVVPAWHLYVVRVDAARRDAVRGHLAERGVQTMVHYPVPPHRQPAYAGYEHGPHAEAERWAAEAISLPIGPHLGKAEQEHVIAAVHEVLG